MTNIFPKGSEAAKTLKQQFINGELPWDIKPTEARNNNENWKKIAVKTFANSFSAVRREAAFQVEEEEAKKGTKKTKKIG